jgi:hypothetical protein
VNILVGNLAQNANNMLIASSKNRASTQYYQFLALHFAKWKWLRAEINS